MNHNPVSRSTAIDAFRGAVMLLLIPDVLGGLSMYKLAAAHPDSSLAAFLALQLTHAEWSGCRAWDLIMPGFLFAAGMSMAYSRLQRLEASHARGATNLHVALRAAALLILGMLVQMPVSTYADLAWPLVIVALGLPWRRWLGTGTSRGGVDQRAGWTMSLCVLAFAAAWLATQAGRGSWHFHDILPQLGLAYGFAYLLATLPPRHRALAVVCILVGYWLLFAAYPTPPPGFDMAAVGVQPGDELYSGLFAHWNKGANAAAAFDRAFLNLLPRAEPFVYNGHGYQTLSFIPAIASIVLGAMAGDLLLSGIGRKAIRNRLLGAGAACLALGSLAGLTVCPIVKSIWTPSWVLFSTGCVLTIFAAFYHAFDMSSLARWAMPLVAVGSSPLLPYVLAVYYRPWILEAWQKTLGLGPMDAGWSAVAASGLVGISIWTVAFVMYRLRITVRL